MTDFAGTGETLAAAVDDLGGLHVVLTTAGGGVAEKTFGKNGPHSLETFQNTINLNLIASFNISRLAAEHMSKNEPEDEERGVIINTASIAAFEGQIGPGGLHRRQGRHRGHVPDHGARPRPRSVSARWPSRRACSPPV